MAKSSWRNRSKFHATLSHDSNTRMNIAEARAPAAGLGAGKHAPICTARFRSGRRRSKSPTAIPKSSPLYERFRHPTFLLSSTLLYFYLLVLTRTSFSRAGGFERSLVHESSIVAEGWLYWIKINGGGSRSRLKFRQHTTPVPSISIFTFSAPSINPCTRRVYPLVSCASFFFILFCFFFCFFFCFSVSFARNRFDYEMYLSACRWSSIRVSTVQ